MLEVNEREIKKAISIYKIDPTLINNKNKSRVFKVFAKFKL